MGDSDADGICENLSATGYVADLWCAQPRDLIHKISTREDKYNICEMVHLSLGEEKIKEKIDKYPAVIQEYIPFM